VSGMVADGKRIFYLSGEESVAGCINCLDYMLVISFFLQDWSVSYRKR